MAPNLEMDTIFTDGASRGNPGPGGWGAVVAFAARPGKAEEAGSFSVEELGGREERTTNNRMELRAAIEALARFQSRPGGERPIAVYSDSAYLVNGITRWVSGWRKNGWQTSQRAPVENRDLWEQLVRFSDGARIRWTVLAGHAGIAGNERCDEIATAFADGEAPALYRGPLDAYPLRAVFAAPGAAEAGAVRKSGRSRAPARSYVSFVDGAVKIHATWAECEARVKGKSGARYKKARSLEEERRIAREFGGI